MKLHIKIVLTTMLALLLLICLAGFTPVFSQAPLNWVITGRIMVPNPETKENMAITAAIVTLTDKDGEIHIVTTGENGYYFFKNLAVNAKCVITAIAIVNNKTMVLKDVVPEAVAAPNTYDAGTTNAESTALALIVEELIKQGATDENIDLEIIQKGGNFNIVEKQVLSVLEDNGNVMDDIVVAGEEVISEEELESTGANASDFTVSDEAGIIYKVTVTILESSDDESIADTAAQTSRDTYNINASFIGSGAIEPSGLIIINKDDDLTLAVRPNSNYHIVGIKIDGALEVGPFVSPYTYTFTNITTDHTIEAYFSIDTYAIAVIAGDNGSISPSGAVFVDYGSDQTFTISPDPNFHIDDVLVDGLSIGAVNSHTFENVIEDVHSIAATFAIDTYTLTTDIDADGTGEGRVSPTVGVHTYDYGDKVNISAEADPSSTFSGWSGASNSENSDETLTMTENKNVTASFVLNTYTLDVNKTGSGTVSIDPVQDNYNHGDVVTITATANLLSSDFVGWAGDNSDDLIKNDNGTYSAIMDSDKSVTATFNLKKVTLTVDVAGTGSGKVSPSVGVHTYNYGASVTIGAKADTGRLGTWIATEDMVGSIFAGWRGDASGTGDVTLTMNSNKSITAYFTKRETRTLTMAVDGTGSGTVVPAAGDHMYYLGDEVTVQAIPNKVLGTWIGSTADIDSIFTRWSGAASGTGDVTLTMDSDKIVTATFTLEKVKLTMAVAGTGSGKVVPAAGVHSYEFGETVTVKAIADADSIFTGRSGDATGTGDVTVTMDSNKLITSNFIPKSVKLTMAVAGTGSGKVVPAAGVHPYKFGEEITLSATAVTGSTFTGWSGDASGTSDVTLTMDSKKSVTAIFTLKEVTLTMAVTGTGSGTVSPTVGEHTCNYGDKVTIKATADPSSDFDGWSGDTSGTSDVTLTMDSKKSVTAIFTLKTYTITASVVGSGTISPSGAQTVDHGGSQSFAITPDDNYHILDVLVDGVSVGAVSTYTFSGVTAVHIIAASFAIDTYTITPTAGDNGFINPSGDQIVDHGGSQTFTITADPNYHILDVLIDGDSVGVESSYTFTGVTAAHDIEATFAIDTYTITPTAGDNGYISPSGDQIVDHGGSQSFTITPDDNYHIADILVDGITSVIGDMVGDIYTFINVAADHDIEATFAIDTYTITPTAGDNGSIDPSGTQTVDHGGSQSFTISPDAGYRILDVVVDNVSKGDVTSYTFSNVITAHTIAATFAMDTNIITASAGDNGTISPSGAVIVNYNSSQSFTITPDDNYHILDVLVDGKSVGTVGSYEFTNVTTAHTIAATFATSTFDLTISAGSGGTTVPEPGTYYNYEIGTVLDIDAIEDDDYEFDKWTGDVATVIDVNSASTTIGMNSDKTVNANFTKIFTIEDLRLHANLGSKSDEKGVWDLHVFIQFKKNDLNQDGNFTIRIKSSQASSGITIWYPSEYDTEPIVIPRGQNRYPSGNDAWLLESVGESIKKNEKPKDVLVEVWIFDNNSSDAAYGSKYAN